MKKLKKRITSFENILVICMIVISVAGVLFAVHVGLSGKGSVPVYAGEGEWTPEPTLDNRVATTEFIKIKEDRQGYFTVPLPEGTKPDSVIVTNDYASRMALIKVPGADMDFYHKNPFSGDMGNVTAVKYGFDEEGAVIELDCNGTYETESDIVEDRLYIKFVPPHEIYDKILVVDAAYGGEETGSVGYGVSEKDITLSVSEAIRNNLSDNRVKVYFTRTGDNTVSVSDRVKLINDVDADMVITLSVAGDEDTRITKGMNVLFYSIAEADAAQYILDTVSSASGAVPNVTAYQAKGALENSSDSRFFGVDLAYITNKSDAESYQDEKKVNAVASAVYEAAVNVLEE